MSINLPPELLASLTTAAECAGITVEEFVLITLEAKIRHSPEGDGRPIPANGGPTMYDKLAKYIGSIDGPSGPFSMDTSDRFTDIIVDDSQRERK